MRSLPTALLIAILWAPDPGARADAPRPASPVIWLDSIQEAAHLLALADRAADPAREPAAVADARALLGPLAAGLKVASRADLDGLLRSGRVRVRPGTGNYLVSMNLRRLAQVLPAPGQRPPSPEALARALDAQAALVEGLLGVAPPKVTDAAAVEALRKRIAALDERFLLLLDHGFDPAAGPSAADVFTVLADRLGTPPTRVTGVRPVVAAPDGKTVTELQAEEVTLDVGLDQPLRIKNVRLGNAEVGFFYPHRSLPTAGWLDELRRTCPRLKLPAGLQLTVERLVLRDQVLVADLALDLPMPGGGRAPRLVFHDVVRRAAGGRFTWTWDDGPRELFVGKDLGDDLSAEVLAAGALRYDRATGVLTVQGTPTARDIDLLSRSPALAKSVPFGIALQRIREQRPRLDLGGYVQEGVLATAGLAGLPAGAARLVAVAVEDGPRAEAGVTRLRSLAEAIEKDPGAWLAAVVKADRPSSVPAGGRPFRVVLQIGPDRVAVGGAVAADGRLTWENTAGGLPRIRTNAEVLAAYLAARLPLLPDPTGAAPPVRVDEVDFDPAAGELAVGLTWASPGFDQPVRIRLRVPLRPGVAMDWRKPVAEALAGRVFKVGPALELHFDERQPDRDDWSASVELAGVKLPVRIGTRDGRLAVTDWDRPAIERWLGRHLPAAAGPIGPAIGSVTARLDVTCERERVAAALCFDVRPGKEANGPHVEVRADRSGVYVTGLEAVVADRLLGELRTVVPDVFGLKVVRAQRVGTGFDADVELAIGGKPVGRLGGLRYAGGKLTSAGTLELTPEGQQIVARTLKLEGKGWRVGVTRLSTAATGGLAADVTAVVDQVGELRLTGIRLGPKGLTADAVVDVLGPALVARLPELKSVDVGPFRVSFGRARFADRAVEVPVSIECPALGARLRFPNATFRLDGGWALGPVEGKGPDAGPLVERLGAIAGGGLDLVGAQVRATNPRWEAATPGDVTVTFDVEVKAGERTAVVSGNRFGREGLRPGDLAPLNGLAVGKATDLLTDLGWWQKAPRRVDLGVVALANIRVEGRQATADVEVLGGPGGRLRVEFPAGGGPKATWEEQGQLYARLRAWAGGWPFRLAQDRIEIGAAELLPDGVRLPVRVRLPELEMDAVPVGAVEVGRFGLRLAGAPDLEAVFWQKLAGAVAGRKLTPAGLPVEAAVRRADARPDGLDAELVIRIDPVGEVAVTFSVAKDGVRLDRDSLLASLAGLVQRELTRRLPQGRVTLGPVAVKDGALLLPFQVDVGLTAPVDVAVRIDRAGVHWPDLGQVAAAGLNELLARLDGQSLAITSDIVLKIPKGSARVSLDPRGVVLAGEAKLGPVTLHVADVFFDGKKVDLARAKITPDLTAVTRLFGELGFDGFGIDKVVPDLPGGRVFIGCKVKLVGVLEAVVTVRIGRDGFGLVLPVTFSAGNAIQVPLAPSPFLLTNFGVTLADDHVGGQCTLTLLQAELQKLIRMDARIRIPFKGPKVIAVRGDLVLMSVLPVGNAVATLDFDRKKFETTALIGVRRVIELDGHIVLDFGKLEFAGEGSLKAFGASLAHAKVYVNRQKFGAEAMLNLLLVYSKAKLDGAWSPLSDTRLEATVKFGFYALGQHVTVAGARVEASLRPSAKFTAEILGQDIVLADVDLGGITIQRIIDAILRQPICLTGFKLFASEGGGGVASALVDERGGMHLKVTDPKTGRVVKQVSLVDQNGAILMAITTPESGGGTSTRIVDPARDRETTIHAGPAPAVKPDVRTRPMFGTGKREDGPKLPWKDWDPVRSVPER